jgi:phage terminase large subunit-like protein
MQIPKNLRLFGTMREALALDWRSKARPEQLPPPGNWAGWICLSGRGWGKTFVGSNFICEEVAARRARRIALIGPTSADCRDVMVEGVSGILACAGHDRPEYEPSKRRLTWRNGAIATTFSAEEWDRLRGPQHDLIWFDELAAFENAQSVWDQAMFGLRLGRKPRWLVTTTPRPIALLKKLVAREGIDVVISRGSTFENEKNLAPQFLEEIKQRYEGTRLGRQELNAEILSDHAGALFTREILERAHWGGPVPEMRRIVVAVDPSGTSGDDGGDAVGIVVCGVGVDRVGYVLEDLTVKASPGVWGRVAVDAYRRWKADRVVGERNFGGAMIQHVIRTADPNVSYRDVHASRGKIQRAEPIAALFEQSRVRLVGNLQALEDQLSAFTGEGYAGDGSPDRADAAIWALTELMLTPQTPVAAFSTYSASAPRATQSKFDGQIKEGPLAGGFASSR